MESRKKTKSFLKDDLHKAEFTSGQLVLGVCGLLVVAIGIFMTGILLERWQNRSEDRVAAATPDVLAPGITRTPAPQNTRTATKTPPAPRRLEAPPAPNPTRTADKQQPKNNRPEKVTTAKTSPKPAAIAPKTSPKETQTTPSADKATPKKVDTPAVAKAPQQPIKKPTTTVAKAPPKPIPPPKKSTPVKKGPRYSVQVAAFGNPANATASKRRLEALTNLKVELVKPAGSKMTYVFVGNFDNRAAANKSRDELRKSAGFKDCFVKTRK